MNTMDKTWQRTVEAARRAAPAAPLEAPFGFPQRVVARWLAAPEESLADIWARVASRVMLGAALVMVATVAVNFPMLSLAWESWSETGPIMEILVAL
jgi:hypothetical protein